MVAGRPHTTFHYCLASFHYFSAKIEGRWPSAAATLWVLYLVENLSKNIRKKKIIHSIYKSKIDKYKGLKISCASHPNKCNYWLNILEINKRLSKKELSKIIQQFNKHGIEVRPLWYPNHLQKKYKKCQTYKLSNVKKIYQKRLCLPSSSQLTAKQQNFICKKLNNIF